MKRSLYPLRLLFLLTSVFSFFSLAKTSAWLGADTSALTGLFGGLVGLLVGIGLLLIENFLPKVSIRSVNILILGLFFGYLFGQCLIWCFDALRLPLELTITEPIHLLLVLSALYFGVLLTFRSSNHLALSIPYLHLEKDDNRQRRFVLDISALADSRIVDFALTGFLDRAIILPRFLLRDLYLLMEKGDEIQKVQARKAYEGWKKLESLPQLDLQIIDSTEEREPKGKTDLLLFAHSARAYLLTSELTRIEHAPLDDEVKLLNLNEIAKALKPPKQYGEYLFIKVQRYGKEPRQGVGYLEDGTMVVINGGAEYIGELIRAQVLSIKHTSSGRMIFCNALEENEGDGYPSNEVHASSSLS